MDFSNRIMPTADDAAIIRRRLARLVRECVAAGGDAARQFAVVRASLDDYTERAPALAASAYLNRPIRHLHAVEHAARCVA